MRRLALALLLCPLLTASAIARQGREPFGAALKAALAEQAHADAETTRLEQAAEPKAEGQRICVELMQKLSALKGVAGVHVMAPLNESALAPTLAEFRQLLAR